MAGKKQNMAPMWKKTKKDVDPDEPTSFLDHVFLGCTQRECKPNETIVVQYRDMNHVLLLEQLKNCQGGKKAHAKTIARSHDKEGHAQKMR